MGHHLQISRGDVPNISLDWQSIQRYSPAIMALDPGDTRHGTRNGYNNLGCRCDACKSAEAEYQTTRRTNRTALNRAGQVRLRHARVSTYNNYGCRCELCKRAKRNDTRARRVAAKEKAALALDVANFQAYGRPPLSGMDLSEMLKVLQIHKQVLDQQ
jgi:hypothetical protein